VNFLSNCGIHFSMVQNSCHGDEVWSHKFCRNLFRSFKSHT